jgi:Fur family ferric uptake transcriptional regulator
LEFCDPRLQQIKDTVAEIFGININSHSLYLYGTREPDQDQSEK